MPVVRQHDPEHRDRQLRHGRLQGHHPHDGPADHELRVDDGDHPKVVTDTAPNPTRRRTSPLEAHPSAPASSPSQDSAVVELTGGTATPAGSVAFSLCKVDAPGLCATGGTAVGSTNLTGAAYPVTVLSPTAYVTSAGRYCWRAAFSGDSANGIPAVERLASQRVLHRQPGDPTLSTTAGADVVLGGTVTDSADPRRHGDAAGQPGHQPDRHGRTRRRRDDHVQAVRAEQLRLRTAGLHLDRRSPVSGNGTYNTPARSSCQPAPATTTGSPSTAAARRTPTRRPTTPPARTDEDVTSTPLPRR